MRPNAPKKIVWIISIILAVVGIVFYFIPAVESVSFLAVFAGWILLFLGTTLKGF